MLVFGCAVSDPTVYRQVAEPSMRRHAGHGDAIVHRTGLSLQAAYNEILEESAVAPDLEGVILVHEDVELADPDFAGKVRARLRDPAVAILGAIGARGVRSMVMFDSTETFGRVRVTVGGVERWIGSDHPWGAHEVDAVDGVLLALSAWAARELRFDERFAADFHGYDTDVCFQARARGRKVVVEELDIVHHHHGRFLEEPDRWARAVLRWARKWEPSQAAVEDAD